MKKLIYHAYCRLFQKALYFVSPLMPYKKQLLYTGSNSLHTLLSIIKKEGKEHVCIISDTHIVALDSVKELFNILKKENISFVVYDEVLPNPTVSTVEKAKEFYIKHSCDTLVALGGGSCIDTAKAVGALIAYPKKRLDEMKGLLKVHRPIPFLIAIPTTAGTGSEATVASVITNPAKKEKYAINSFPLIPKVAILDPLLTITLSSHITTTTAMDALTHAIEAYIGNSTSSYSRQASIDATTIIFKVLEHLYNNPQDTEARQQMLIASYRAGEAFTRSYVGNVHALSHPLSAHYNIPHGLANAIVLPHVLSYYGDKVYKKVATLSHSARVVEVGKSDEVTTKLFIQKIEDLNEKFGIPNYVKEIQEEDIDAMTLHALAEANPLYPVPVIFDTIDCKNVYHKLMKKE